MHRCPYCEARDVEVIRRLWYMRGYLLLARYGSVHVLSCRSCAAGRIWTVLLRNLGLGWWSIPWGLATPAVIVQNLLQLVPRPEEQEIKRLMRSGPRVSPGTT